MKFREETFMCVAKNPLTSFSMRSGFFLDSVGENASWAKIYKPKKDGVWRDLRLTNNLRLDLLNPIAPSFE